MVLFYKYLDEGGGGVIDCYVVFFDDLEMLVLVGGIWCVFVENFGDFVVQWVVDVVGVVGDLVDVGGVLEYVVVWFDIENGVYCVVILSEIVVVGVYNVFGFVGGV